MYDPIMGLTVEITPFLLPELTFPKDFVVGTMVEAFECGGR